MTANYSHNSTAQRFLLRMPRTVASATPGDHHEFKFGELVKAFEMMSNKTDDIITPLIRVS